MINLAHIREQIKSSDLSGVKFNATAPLGTNEAYRYLKTLGWTCANEVHPRERVPVFRLGGASIRRDKQNPGGWIVDVAGGSFSAGGDLDLITAEAQRLDAEASEPAPQPIAPAQEIATGLKAEYPHLVSRIDAALVLVEAGQIEFPKYGTSCEIVAGGHPLRDCNCPDAMHRGFRAGFGLACKHTITQEITWRMERDFNQVVQREIVDQIEQRRAADARYAAALRPDPINRRQQRGMEVHGIGHL